MRRRIALLIAPLAALSLIGAGCGGGGSKSSSSSGTPSSTDPATILSSIKAPSNDAPAKVTISADVAVKGSISNPQVAAIIDDGKVTMSLTGPVDPKTKSMDLAFTLKAGKINLAGALRIADGKKGFVQLGGKWYELPAESFDASKVEEAGDPQKILDSLGDLTKLFKDPKVVGSETIDGVDSDHISGSVDTAGLMQAIAKVAAATGEAGPSQADIDEAVSQLEKYLQSATVDLWVGKDDKQVHKMTVKADVALPDSAKSSIGADGITMSVTVQSTPTDAPSISAPSGALPSTQLQADLGTILLSSLGGSSSPTP